MSRDGDPRGVRQGRAGDYGIRGVPPGVRGVGPTSHPTRRSRSGGIAGGGTTDWSISRPTGTGCRGVRKSLPAQDPQLDRDVAIKVAKVGLWPSDEDRQRFLREARAAAQLRHPHIVPVYEFGEVGEADYIAYQYVPGTTLRHILSRHKKMTVSQAVDLTAKIANALHYAHTKNIIHRDVKPENILVDEEGQPHVADFGCARREDSGGLLTVEGQVMGTPAYMSPEQAAGQARLADGRSDVWSVGVMLEEMLTGRRPFRGTLTELLISIREQEPKPIRQVDAGLPKDLETICQKCLAKNPDERFPTALVLQEELERFRRGEPILSRRIGVWARTWRWAKRNRTVAALLAGIVATFAIAAIVSTLLSLRLVSAQRARARDLGVQLLTALPQNLRLLLDDIDSDYRELVRQPLLAAMPTSSELAESPSFSRPAARAPLGLIALGLPAKEEAAAGHQLLDQILRTSPAEVDELTALRDGLQQHGSPALLNQLSQRLWQQAEELQQEGTPRLQVFATLAAFDPHSPRWDDFARDVTDRLLATDPLLLPQWLDAIAPLRERLKQDLTDLFHRGTLPQQQSAARALARWFVDDPESRQEFVKYVLSAVPEQLGPLLSVLRHGDASRRTDWIARFTAAADAARSDPSELSEDQVISWANGAIALDTLDSPAILREGFQAVTDPSLRTELIPRVAASGMEVRDIWNEIQRGSPQPASTEVFHTAPADDLEVASWLLVFGNVDPGRQFAAERDLFLPQLDALARQHPDPGVHGAARWAIRQWGDTTFQNQASSAPIGRPGATPSRPSWRVNQAGTTLVALGPAPRFVIGSPLAEQRRFYPAGMSEIEEGEQQRPVALGYRFEVASFEVTSREFQSFERAWTEQINQAHCRKPRTPATKNESMTWKALSIFTKGNATLVRTWCVIPRTPREACHGTTPWRTAAGSPRWKIETRPTGATPLWSTSPFPRASWTRSSRGKTWSPAAPIGCRPPRSGNMPLVPVPPRPGSGGDSNDAAVNTAGSRRATPMTRCGPSGEKNPIGSDSSIPRAISPNGAKTSRQVATRCGGHFAEVPTSILSKTCGPPSYSGSPRTENSTMSASVSREPSQ